MRVLTVVVLVVSLVGCAPMAGDSCTGDLLCAVENKNAAWFCEGGQLTGYQCAGGCSTTGMGQAGVDRVTCDIRGNAVETKCPAFFSGQGQCEQTGTLLLCDAATRLWKRQECPGGCVVAANNKIECRP